VPHPRLISRETDIHLLGLSSTSAPLVSSPTKDQTPFALNSAISAPGRRTSVARRMHSCFLTSHHLLPTPSRSLQQPCRPPSPSPARSQLRHSSLQPPHTLRLPQLAPRPHRHTKQHRRYQSRLPSPLPSKQRQFTSLSSCRPPPRQSKWWSLRSSPSTTNLQGCPSDLLYPSCRRWVSSDL
jgi:hypothetical protein